MRPFGEAQRKATRAYAQRGQYHTIVESRVHLTPTTQGDIRLNQNPHADPSLEHHLKCPMSQSHLVWLGMGMQPWTTRLERA